MTVPPVQHSRGAKRPRARRALLITAISLAVVVVAGGSVAAITAAQLYNGIDQVDIGGSHDLPAVGAIKGGFNILVVGSDACLEGQDCKDIGVRTAALNDVTMLLHVSEDQTSAVAVSIPRDLIVPIPSCRKTDGSGDYPAMSAQPINTTLSYGGLACTVLTVEALSGLDIQYAGLITFQGVVAMSDAIGGVPVCITKDLDDTYTNLHLKAGTTVLKGKEALEFLRTRHGVGNGSDLTRISSQQVYLSSLVRTIKSADTLGDPLKVYNLAVAATQNMQLSTSLAKPTTLVSIALALKNVPLNRVVFVQFPSVTDPANANKVIPNATVSAALWGYLKKDVAFSLPKAGDDVGSVIDPSATATSSAPPTTSTPTKTATQPPTSSATATAPAVEPTLPATGQRASDNTCSVPR